MMLPAQLDSTLSGKELRLLKGAVLTDLDIIFQDSLFRTMADKNSVLDDI